MWAHDSVFYQIYPLGFCGAPSQNDGKTVSRIRKVMQWIGQIKKTGANAVYFCPVFQSDSHGYDTRDYQVIDCRLGTNADFSEVCQSLHSAGVRVVLDGVFNHVGRGFWAFQDVMKNRSSSPYCDWFVDLDFNNDNGYHDGFAYQGWEGHYELVKLNLQNEKVIQYIFECIAGWVREFDIDGLRLDVAYSLPADFMSSLRKFCDEIKPDFYLLGEMLHGDYSNLMNEDMLHSVTNYQAYKGIWSSFNSMNMFEINYTLEQHFCQKYVGSHPLNFVDNHDVTRLASILTNAEHLKLAYALLFAIPGIPCIYYGSEWGALGRKEDGDDALRPCFDNPQSNELTDFISLCAEIYKREKSFRYGSFNKVLLTNRQYIFERALEGERILIAINADSVPYTAHFQTTFDQGMDLLTGNTWRFTGECNLSPYSVYYWKILDR